MQIVTWITKLNFRGNWEFCHETEHKLLRYVNNWRLPQDNNISWSKCLSKIELLDYWWYTGCTTKAPHTYISRINVFTWSILLWHTSALLNVFHSSINWYSGIRRERITSSYPYYSKNVELTHELSITDKTDGGP
jgi:hypothetical protein